MIKGKRLQNNNELFSSLIDSLSVLMGSIPMGDFKEFLYPTPSYV